MGKSRDGEMREELGRLFEEELHRVEEGVDVCVCAHFVCLCSIMLYFVAL